MLPRGWTAPRIAVPGWAGFPGDQAGGGRTCNHFGHLPVTHTEVWGLQAALMDISPRGHQARIAPDVVALSAGWPLVELCTPGAGSFVP